MLKRKDGSYSKRGLWDNIRANKGSGKKPTKEMLKQERKINTNKMGGKRKLMKKGGLKGGQVKLDKNKDGVLSGADFKMMKKGGVKKKKKTMYGKGGKKKMMGGGMKNMYESGGFLESKIPNIDDL
tara:strand:+ start:125 stop:502 length:378 start_codon:yes stop_codon:yes gene_type:complete